jgi:hypothetical protein
MTLKPWKFRVNLKLRFCNFDMQIRLNINLSYSEILLKGFFLE